MRGAGCLVAPPHPSDHIAWARTSEGNCVQTDLALQRLSDYFWNANPWMYFHPIRFRGNVWAHICVWEDWHLQRQYCSFVWHIPMRMEKKGKILIQKTPLIQEMVLFERKDSFCVNSAAEYVWMNILEVGWRRRVFFLLFPPLLLTVNLTPFFHQQAVNWGEKKSCLRLSSTSAIGRAVTRGKEMLFLPPSIPHILRRLCSFHFPLS